MQRHSIIFLIFFIISLACNLFAYFLPDNRFKNFSLGGVIFMLIIIFYLIYEEIKIHRKNKRNEIN